MRSSDESFDENLSFGKSAEERVANALRRSGNYDRVVRREGRDGRPDIACFSGGFMVLQVEVKAKETPTYTRNTGKTEFGIDKNRFRGYVDAERDAPVVVVFESEDISFSGWQYLASIRHELSRWPANVTPKSPDYWSRARQMSVRPADGARNGMKTINSMVMTDVNSLFPMNDPEAPWSPEVLR